MPCRLATTVMGLPRSNILSMSLMSCSEYFGGLPGFRFSD